MSRSGWQGMVLVRLVRAGELLEVRPVTLFGAGDAVDLSLWRRPWSLGRPQPANAARDWLERLRASGARRFVRRPRGGTEAALAAAWRQLLDRAETGRRWRNRSTGTSPPMPTGSTATGCRRWPR
ncbi:MAG: hypothetical protein WDN24_11865 [Sphingomonas sp.]